MTGGRGQVQAAGAVLAVLAAGGLGWLIGHQQSGVVGRGGHEVTLRDAIGAL